MRAPPLPAAGAQVFGTLSHQAHSRGCMRGIE
jgi:hypothetical protein